jgi:predicted nucleic acid-binding protein
MSSALVDTNVVLRLLAENDPLHHVANRIIEASLRAQHRLYLAPQVIMESWVVLTRPQNVNGFGWGVDLAREALGGALEYFHFLPETADVFAEWWRLVATGVRGKRAHDARLVALMRVHGLARILTFNGSDFDAFDGIDVVSPHVGLPT